MNFMSVSDKAVAELIRNYEALKKEVDRLKTREFGGILLWEEKLAAPNTRFLIPIARSEFKVLTIMGSLSTDRASATDRAVLQINGLVGANYDYQSLITSGATSTAAETLGATGWYHTYTTGAIATAGLFGTFRTNIMDYADATKFPTYLSYGYQAYANAAGNHAIYHFAGKYRGAVAVNYLKIFPAIGVNFITGSWIRVYGDKG